MRIDIVTLFPEIFPGPLGESIIGGPRPGSWSGSTQSICGTIPTMRAARWMTKPYGGGPGMLMKVEPLVKAVEDLRKPGSMVILTSPRGERFSQKAAPGAGEKRASDHDRRPLRGR